MTGKRPTSKDVRDAELTASTGCGADHAVFQLILHLHHRLADLEQGVAWLASRPAQRATANLEQDHAHSMPAPAPAPAAPLQAFPLTDIAVETARLNWVIEAVVKIHPALLGFHEDELRGPADVTLGELFRAAIDRRLI